MPIHSHKLLGGQSPPLSPYPMPSGEMQQKLGGEKIEGSFALGIGRAPPPILSLGTEDPVGLNPPHL